MAGNAKLLRKINTETVLRIIREQQPISRIEIAKLTGLNKSTVSSIVAELLEADLIFETATVKKGAGRNPLNLSLRLRKHFVGALDLDSPVTRVGIVDIDGSVLGMSTLHVERGLPEKSMAASVKGLRDLCASLDIKLPERIGISVPGVVDSRSLMVQFSPSLQWKHFDVGESVHRLAPDIQDVSVGNGANLSALAELWFGSHETDLTNFVYLSVHRGIGSGLVIDDKLRRGEFQAAGEFGHMVIFDGGELCRCGSKGCLEAYASDSATVKRYTLKKYGKAGSDVDYELQDIIGFAGEGNTAAIEALKETGYYLGVGISNIIKAIDPHVIIVGGQVTQIWDLVYPEIAKVISERAYFGMARDIKIMPTSLTVPPRLLGAATLAIERMFRDYSDFD